jgi:type II secretory pathway component PulC
MQHRIKDILSLLLVLIVIATVLWFFLSMVRIVVFVPVSVWGAVLFILGTIIVIILALDHFLHFL